MAAPCKHFLRIVLGRSSPTPAWVGRVEWRDGTLYAGVARSTDGGLTWTKPDGTGDAMALAAAPGRAAVILAGHDVLKVSRDGGVTWQDQGFGNLPGTDLHGFAVRPDRPSTWFANVAGRGLYRTVDGVTWQAVSPATQASRPRPVGACTR